MVHAFSDHERKNTVRELAMRIRRAVEV